MYTYTKLNSHAYRFITDSGSHYHIIFLREGINSVQIGFDRLRGSADESSNALKILNTVVDCIYSYLNNNTSINEIILNVHGNSQSDINSKINIYENKIKEDTNWTYTKESNKIIILKK